MERLTMNEEWLDDETALSIEIDRLVKDNEAKNAKILEARKTIQQQAEQIVVLSDEINYLRGNEKGRKPSCLINLDLRKEIERLTKKLEMFERLDEGWAKVAIELGYTPKLAATQKGESNGIIE